MFLDASRICSATASRSSSLSLHIPEASTIGIFSKVVDVFESKLKTVPFCNVTVFLSDESTTVVVSDIFALDMVMATVNLGLVCLQLESNSFPLSAL